jgi:glycosyltransferase involved in cell wall biosynthesis
VPPLRYGGTERLVSYLTEALVREGHEVTLFASGDSVTKARLVPGCPQALKEDREIQDWVAYHVLMAEKVFQLSDEFDVIHNHLEYFPYSLARRSQTPMVTTMHWCLEDRKKEWGALYQEFSDMRVVSISDSQRKAFPSINWQATIYHGLPEELYTFQERQGKYLTFLGRIAPEKGIHDAIDLAVRSGMELKIAGNFMDVEFYKQMRPLFKHPLIEYVGEVSDREKNDLLGNAYALLFPISWQEPFGLVMTEALACGTPVIARNRGSIPEVIDDGLTGFIFEQTEQALKAIERIPTLNRSHCRQVFEERFSDSRMARDYVALFERL